MDETQMGTVSAEPWTVDRFLACEHRQEGKHEFDGPRVIPMTGGSIAHQRIVLNIRFSLSVLLTGWTFLPVHEMRIRTGSRVHYPDVAVCAMPVDQTTRTLADAVVLFELLSDDTATTDRVEKLLDYAELPALRCYVPLEHTSIGATAFQRVSGGSWIARRIPPACWHSPHWTSTCRCPICIVV